MVMKRLSCYWYLIRFLLIFVLHVLIGVKFRVFWLRLGRTCFNREAVYWLGCDPRSYRPPIRALGSNILADAAYRGYYDVVRQLISHVVRTSWSCLRILLIIRSACGWIDLVQKLLQSVMQISRHWFVYLTSTTSEVSGFYGCYSGSYNWWIIWDNGSGWVDGLHEEPLWGSTSDKDFAEDHVWRWMHTMQYVRLSVWYYQVYPGNNIVCGHTYYVCSAATFRGSPLL